MKHDSNSAVESQPAEQAKQAESTEQAQPSEQPQPAGQMGVIYKITNTLNGKSYIGKTRQGLGRRITQHKYDSKRGSLGIGAAIRKYGWENFTVEVLEECPIELLNEREIFWIAELNSKAPNGYNLTDGGDGGRGCSPSAETRAKLSAKMKGRPAHNKGQKMSAETCARMSATKKAMGFMPPSTKGRHHSEESKAKMSVAQSGSNNPQYGKHHSEETRAKMSLAQKGRPAHNKGKPHSPETRAKIAAGVKAFWARKKAVENGGK